MIKYREYEYSTRTSDEVDKKFNERLSKKKKKNTSGNVRYSYDKNRITKPKGKCLKGQRRTITEEMVITTTKNTGSRKILLIVGDVIIVDYHAVGKYMVIHKLKTKGSSLTINNKVVEKIIENTKTYI